MESLFCFSTYKKHILSAPPRDQSNPLAYSYSLILHTAYKNDMIGRGTSKAH